MGIEQFLLERAKTEGKTEGKIEGKIEGGDEQSRLIVESILLNTNFEVEKIAAMTGLSIDFVLQVKKKMK